ncbi:lysine-rich nucleolar protein 1-like [Argopecten irradians]|uniref:lysine-rich nucleolar protein 1-like n=1 Tax=Argopecten irradians TaxID=31199 RepID=UPI003713CCB0
MAEITDSDAILERKSKKKKKKKEKECEIMEEGNTNSQKKDKKKKRERHDSNDEQLEIRNDDGGTAVTKKKKKKKKVDLKDDTDSPVAEQKNKKNKEIKNEDEMDTSSVVKKKKKKNREKEVPEEVTEMTTKEARKERKKNKKSKKELIDVEIEANVKANKKKKKRSADACENGTSSSRDKTSKSERDSPQTDVSGPVKKKKRKHSLEEISTKKLKKDKKTNFDINKETSTISNGDTTSDTGNTVPGPVVGQWGTSSLGNEARQQKFIRLLGGFKKESDNSSSFGAKQSKGLFGSLKAASVKTSGCGNKAMDATQEKMYLTNMEKDYERAMSMNLNRGIGLGFEKPPSEGKKFYIDTKASKSIKFDD